MGAQRCGFSRCSTDVRLPRRPVLGTLAQTPSLFYDCAAKKSCSWGHLRPAEFNGVPETVYSASVIGCQVQNNVVTLWLTGRRLWFCKCLHPQRFRRRVTSLFQHLTAHTNTSVGSRDVPGWSRPAGRAGHVGRGRVKIFVDALGRVGLMILVINFCLLEDLCIHSESKLFHHVNSAFQISMSHNVLFCCSLCILSVHVVFPRLYISDHKFSSVENVNSVLLKFDLLASLWAGRVPLGHCFACDQWIGWCRVGTLAGRVGS